MFMLALGVWTRFCDYFILDSCIVKAVVVSFSVWKQITRISGATVATRGRYLTEDELSRAEPGYTAPSVVVLCSLLVQLAVVMSQLWLSSQPRASCSHVSWWSAAGKIIVGLTESSSSLPLSHLISQLTAWDHCFIMSMTGLSCVVDIWWLIDGGHVSRVTAAVDMLLSSAVYYHDYYYCYRHRWPAHVVQWSNHLGAMCSRAWRSQWPRID